MIEQSDPHLPETVDSLSDDYSIQDQRNCRNFEHARGGDKVWHLYVPGRDVLQDGGAE